jgi:hypothetical protein
MDYTILIFKKIQFLDTWKQTIAPGKYIAAYDAESTTARLLVVTESPDLGGHTYEFELAKTDRVNVSTQRGIIQIPGNCVANSQGDATSCSRR